MPKGMELTELDKKVLYYQDRGHLVPSRELIKTPEQIEGIRRSGIINTGVLDLVEREIHAGMSTLEIDKLVYEYTKDHGGIPATLGYEGLPKSCCSSIKILTSLPKHRHSMIFSCFLERIIKPSSYTTCDCLRTADTTLTDDKCISFIRKSLKILKKLYCFLAVFIRI